MGEQVTYALIIEDDSAVADLEATLLQRESIASRVVQSADAALEALAESLPSIAIVDIHLAGVIDGNALIGRIRREWGDVPPILVTSGALSDDQVDFLSQYGNIEMLPKPFRVKDFHDALIRLVPALPQNSH